MAEPKETIMVLKVDLQCSKCYKKVKKVLCKFPQIRDQVYDEKANKVTITVFCCNPEKVRDKLCCKGGGSIKSIEIVEPSPPKPPPPKQEKPKDPEKKPEKAKDPEKKPEKPKEPEKKPPPAETPKPPPPEKPKPPPKEPEPAPPPPKEHKYPPPLKEPEPAPPPPKQPEPAPPPPKPAPPPPQPAPPPPPTLAPEPVPAYPLAPYAPIGFCCSDCYHGHTGGPCFQGYGPPTSYGRPVYDSWGGGGGYRTCYTPCDYFSEENSQACSIM